MEEVERRRNGRVSDAVFQGAPRWWWVEIHKSWSCKSWMKFIVSHRNCAPRVCVGVFCHGIGSDKRSQHWGLAGMRWMHCFVQFVHVGREDRTSWDPVFRTGRIRLGTHCSASSPKSLPSHSVAVDLCGISKPFYRWFSRDKCLEVCHNGRFTWFDCAIN